MTVRQAQTRAMSFFPSEKPIGATPQTPVYAILPPYNFDKGFAFCLPALRSGRSGERNRAGDRHTNVSV